MSETFPLVETGDIQSIKRVLTKWNCIKEAQVFYIGCHVGLRINDLLGLTFKQIETGFINVIEQKTKKVRIAIPVTPIIYTAIETLREFYAANGVKDPVYLFQSMGRNVKDIKPISDKYFRRKFKEAVEAVGLDVENYSTHTLRKTFGYHVFKQTGSVREVQRIFNHSSELQTLTYIGVTRQTVQNTYHELDLA